MTLIFWSVLLVIVVILSFTFAYNSMKSYQVVPGAKFSYGLFLLSNPKISLNNKLISEIYDFSLKYGSPISFERLQKGNEAALAIYAPLQLKPQLKDYLLLEIEDYFKESEPGEGETSKALKVSEADSLVWRMEPKVNLKKDLLVKSDFLKMVNLREGQDFFWQIVVDAEKNADKKLFQTTIRGVVVDRNPVTRVELAKEIDQHITDSTGLIRQQSKDSINQLFDSFKKRSLIPKERSVFMISDEELEALLGFS